MCKALYFVICVTVAFAGSSHARLITAEPCVDVGAAFAKYAHAFITVSGIEGVREYLVNKTGTDVSVEENAISYVCRITAVTSVAEMVQIMDLSPIDEELFIQALANMRQDTPNGKYYKDATKRRDVFLNALELISETNFPNFPTGYTETEAKALFAEYDAETLANVFCFYPTPSTTGPFIKAFANAQSLEEFVRQTGTEMCLPFYKSPDFGKHLEAGVQFGTAELGFLSAMFRSGFLDLPLAK